MASLRRKRRRSTPADVPPAAGSRAAVVTAHATSLELQAEEGSQDHLGSLPVMRLDILSLSSIPFALFTKQYPHDTSSKLSGQKCSPDPPHAGFQREAAAGIFTRSSILG